MCQLYHRVIFIKMYKCHGPLAEFSMRNFCHRQYLKILVLPVHHDPRVKLVYLTSFTL